MPPEVSILGVMIGMMLLFEALGWIFEGQTFIFNRLRLKIMILQESEIGIIAVGVTMCIIIGGIDLSSGSLVGMTAMVAASLAQVSGYSHAIYPSLTGLNPVFPVAAGLLCGLIVGVINGGLIAYTKIPPFIATLGMMVSARGVADWYTNGEPIGNLEDSFAAIGSGWWPVIIFLVRRLRVPHRAALHALRQVHLRDRRQPACRARLGHQCRAPSSSSSTCLPACCRASRASCIPRAQSPARRASAWDSNSTPSPRRSLAARRSSGGVGRMTGTVIGAVILGILTSGFTFLNVDAHYQEIIKGGVIVAAVITDQYRQRRRRKA